MAEEPSRVRLIFVDTPPGGRIAAYDFEEDGSLTWSILRGAMTERLRGQMEEQINYMLLYYWKIGQDPGLDSELSRTARRSRTIHMFVDSLPGEHVVLPLDNEGTTIWQIVRGEMSEELLTELNRLVEDFRVRHLLIHHWEDEPPPPTITQPE